VKKPAIILLCLLYILPAIGFSMDLHWCGKSVKLVTFDSAHEKKCPCSKKMSSSCCKDVHVSIKLSDNQKNASRVIAPSNDFVKHFNFAICLFVSLPASQVEAFDFADYHAPPFKSKQPVYLANSVFLI
jgi:hypothetical protein